MGRKLSIQESIFKNYPGWYSNKMEFKIAHQLYFQLGSTFYFSLPSYDPFNFMHIRKISKVSSTEYTDYSYNGSEVKNQPGLIDERVMSFERYLQKYKIREELETWKV